MTWKKYCTTLLGLSLGAIIFYVGVAEWMLHRLNEAHVGDDAAISMQIEDNALYGSALTGDVAFLKYGVISRIKPDILALGTSRSMQFRAPFFKDATFYTVGGLGDSVDAMEDVFDRVCSSYTPKIVIFAVDWDWLNPNYAHNKSSHVFEEKNMLSNKAYVYKCLYQALWQNKNVREQLLRPAIRERDVIGDHPTIGLLAGVKSEGFRADGSFQYGDAILHPRSIEERFEDTRKRIREGNRRFENADHIDADELLKLASFIHKMKSHGCHVLVLLSPFPNEIYQRFMDSEGHGRFILQFEQSVQELCMKQNVPFYDFSDMAWLDAPDEEALDGFHASERTYGRIVLQFESDSVIAPYIDKEFVEKCMSDSNSPIQIVPAGM